VKITLSERFATKYAHHGLSAPRKQKACRPAERQGASRTARQHLKVTGSELEVNAEDSGPPPTPSNRFYASIIRKARGDWKGNGGAEGR
jgi:hypothetical protein